MGGIFYYTLVDVLEDAGVRCAVNSTNAGWENRSRGSGGFDSPPLGVCWHHTASSASVNNDLSYMIHNSPDAPIGNMLLARDGIVYPIAAGAANTQGKGGPTQFSRGTVPLDSGNTRMWGIEAANNGVGEAWPQVQIDAYFKCNNALAELFGNQVTDCISHQGYAPSRKVDPATAAAVQGPWRPNSVTSSGTWSVPDIQAEAVRRSTSGPQPQPPSTGDLMYTILAVNGSDVAFGGVMDANGIAGQITWLNPVRYQTCLNLGAPVVNVNAFDLSNCDLLGAVPPGFNESDFDNVIT
jgi:hypothetical protein